MRSPRVVIGAILFNHASEFREALESILAQTYEDFAIVLVDDQSTDETPAIAREYAALDPRVSYVTNPARLGMVANSVRAFELAREQYPDAEYFAWASDHDLWHPRWLQQLVDTLDTNPDVVLAYPLNRRIGRAGEVLARKPWAFDTFGIGDPWARVTKSIRHMSAGNMVYGLYRVDVLARAGVYRHILVPDRLLMTELAIYGQFKQVPQVLWFRRWYGRIFSLGRQRANFFPGRRPLYMYAPWWMAHGVSLFWTFAVQGRGIPGVSRLAGGILAIRYLAFSGLFHFWQSIRAVRQDLLERAEVLRPYDRHARLMGREIRRRGAWDWTWSHLKPYIGWKALRKAAARMKKGLKNLAFQSVRTPGLALIRGLRRIPIVRQRVIPSLLKQELDQIPAAPVVAEVNRELTKIRKHAAPIIIGPWLSEVGYELLYWIPFLNWAVKAHGLEQRRLIVISRGGAKPWYQHLNAEYIDVFDLYGVDEYRRKNEERWAELGHQKQSEISAMDRELIAKATARLKLKEPPDVLHPSLMYRLLRFYWFEKAGVGLLTKHTDYRRLAPIETIRWTTDLPSEYVAARFYFRPSFPDTPENRRFAADVVRTISRDVPVVLLNTGFSVDDHEDLHVPGGMGIYRVDHLMTPERNLEVQTEIISRAKAFVGTYGGLAYLGPYYGVPSIGFYANETELVPVHLDVGWRLGRAMNAPVSTVDARSADILRLALGNWRRESFVEDTPRAAVAGVLNK
jgi:glycosyltransferase involved in cell wall biosynthesis